MDTLATSRSLFEIDAELDALLDEIQEQIELKGEPSTELTQRFDLFCHAHGEKVDRLGRFVHMMEAREQFCRSEASRLLDRARAAANKANRTKAMVLYFMLSRELRKVEGREFTLRLQKNSQDTVTIHDEAALPLAYCKLELRLDGALWNAVLSCLPHELAKAVSSSVVEKRPNLDIIKDAARRDEHVLGVEIRRCFHLRVS